MRNSSGKDDLEKEDLMMLLNPLKELQPTKRRKL